jgi:hypothetical protein
MCQTIIIAKKTEKRQTKIYIDTIQEFIDYFGFIPISKATYGRLRLLGCLCQIDIGKELKEHGIDFITNGFDYEILPANNIQTTN